MRIKQILSIIFVLLLVVSIGACKPRDKENTEKQKGARENVEISENPQVQETAKPVVASSSESSSEVEADPVPEEMTKSLLSAAKSGERAKIQEFADYNTLFNLQEGQDADWILQQILFRLKYEVLSCDVFEDKALASVKVSNVDMGTVLPIYFEKAMKIEYDNAANDLQKPRDQLETEYRKVFVDLMTQHEKGRIEKLVDIRLVKKDDKWSIESSPVLGNAILGGYIDAQSAVAASVQLQAESAASELQKVADAAKASEAAEDEPDDNGSSKTNSDLVSKNKNDEDSKYKSGDIEMVKPRE